MCSATWAPGACARRTTAPREVTCVDSSAAALELAAANAARNGTELITRKGDAFEVLEALAKEGARFDVVILDPPAFAKRKKDVPKALAAYKRLNQLAMRLLADDGISGVLLVLLSRERGGIAGCHRQGRARRRQAPADPGNGRPGAGSSGASRHPRDPISQSLFLSRERRFKVTHHAHLSAHQSHRDLDRAGFGIGPLRVHWYGIMYLIGFVAAWWLARYRARRPGSTWTPLDIDDLIFYCAMGVILGGRSAGASFTATT